MSFSIARIIRRLLAPRHELSCAWLLWRRLLRDLRRRGRGATRESGAFLLGRRTEGGPSRITSYILYDDLDPRSLDTGIVTFDGRYFGELWAICRKHSLTVVADVHVHPGGSGQSRSDQVHPMIAEAGHLALILPDFARSPVKRDRVGIYRYLGREQWESVPPARRREFLHIGF
jgi:hypothetical protein